jgi:stage III sporulation protein SpoIIIAA
VAGRQAFFLTHCSARGQVPLVELQHRLMVEAVQNHMPEVIVVDEVGTEAEALACRTIAERGVQLIATAHGRYIGDLLKNPVLSDLVGGVQSVTLGDEEARARGTQKSILERRGPVTFTTTIVRSHRSGVCLSAAAMHPLRHATCFLPAGDARALSVGHTRYSR